MSVSRSGAARTFDADTEKESGRYPSQIPPSARERSRAEQQLAVVFAHDLKSPLSAIAMNLDFAISELPKSDENEILRGAMEDCRAASARAFRMIADMVDAARYESEELSLKLTTIDPVALIERVIKTLEPETRGRRVSLAVTGKALLIDVDHELFSRGLENLLEYIARTLQPGARAEVRVCDGNPMYIEVRCSAPALTPELVEAGTDRIFANPVVRGRAQGRRSLSLYFCRVAIEVHGGHIQLVDVPDAATCFRISVPR